MATPINDYTDCVNSRCKPIEKTYLVKQDVLNLIEGEIKKPYGDFQIGATMALINLRTLINEMGS